MSSWPNDQDKTLGLVFLAMKGSKASIFSNTRYNLVDDCSTSQEPWQAPLPPQVLPSLISSGYSSYQQRLTELLSEKCLDSFPPDQPISFSGPIGRSPRPDSVDWLEEYAYLENDKFACYTDEFKTTPTFSCTVSFFLGTGLPYNPRHRQSLSPLPLIFDSEDRLILFSQPSDSIGDQMTLLAFHNTSDGRFFSLSELILTYQL